KFSLTTLLQIYVDRSERAEIDLNRQTTAELEVDEDARMIEVRAGGVRLATFFLPEVGTSGEGQPRKQTIKLEGGQQLSCEASAITDLDGEITGAKLCVQHQETNPLRAAARW